MSEIERKIDDALRSRYDVRNLPPMLVEILREKVARQINEAQAKSITIEDREVEVARVFQMGDRVITSKGEGIVRFVWTKALTGSSENSYDIKYDGPKHMVERGLIAADIWTPEEADRFEKEEARDLKESRKAYLRAERASLHREDVKLEEERKKTIAEDKQLREWRKRRAMLLDDARS